MQIPGPDSSWRSATAKRSEFRQGLTRGVLLGGAGTLLALGGVAGTLVAVAAGPTHVPAPAAPQVAAVPAAAPASVREIVPPAVLDPAVAMPAAAPAAVAPAAVPASQAVGALTAAMAGVDANDCTDSVLSSALATFVKHVDAAHLQESPLQQVADLINTDQYVKTHTVLLDNMLQPLLSQLPAILDGATTAFVQHVDAAHLQESPFQQAADLINTDQYVKTHTVLVQNMLTNLFGALSTSCGTPMPPAAMPMPMPAAAPAPAPAAAPAIAAPTEVKIVNYAFAPASVHIAVGGTVIWQNADSVAHTVDATTSAFSSGLMNPGSSYSHTFTKAGTYKYYCAVHPDMVGTIVVG